MTYLSYSWNRHPSLVGIANPSRLQPCSLGALGRPNLCLHYTQAIDYFPPSLPAALWPLFRSHYGHTSSHSQPKWRLHSYINRAHLASIVILHLYCTCFPFWQDTSAQLFQSGIDETVSDVTGPSVQWWFALPLWCGSSNVRAGRPRWWLILMDELTERKFSFFRIGLIALNGLLMSLNCISSGRGNILGSQIAFYSANTVLSPEIISNNETGPKCQLRGYSLELLITTVVM